MESQANLLAGLQLALAAPEPRERLANLASLCMQIGDICRTEEGRLAVGLGESGLKLIALLVQQLDPASLLGPAAEVLRAAADDEKESAEDADLLEALCGAQAAAIRALGNLGIMNDHNAEGLLTSDCIPLIARLWNFWWTAGRARGILGSDSWMQLRRNLAGAMGNFVVNNSHSQVLAECWIAAGGVQILTEILETEILPEFCAPGRPGPAPGLPSELAYPSEDPDEEKLDPNAAIVFFGVRALENMGHQVGCQQALATSPAATRVLLRTAQVFLDRNETVSLEALGLLRFVATEDLDMLMGFGPQVAGMSPGQATALAEAEAEQDLLRMLGDGLGGTPAAPASAAPPPRPEQRRQPVALELCLQILRRDQSADPDSEQWPDLQRSALLLGVAVAASGVQESMLLVPEFVRLLESPWAPVREKAAQCLAIVSRAPFALGFLLQPAPLVKLLQLCQAPARPDDAPSFRYDVFLTLSHLMQTDDAASILWKVPGLREFLERVLREAAALARFAREAGGEAAQAEAPRGAFGDLRETLVWARIASSFVRHWSRHPQLQERLLDVELLLAAGGAARHAGGAEAKQPPQPILDVIPLLLELLLQPHQNHGHVLQLHLHTVMLLRTLVGNAGSPKEKPALQAAVVRMLRRWRSGHSSSAEVAAASKPQLARHRDSAIAEFCRWYDHPAPHLRYESGRLVARLCGFEEDGTAAPGDPGLFDVFTPPSAEDAEAGVPSPLLSLYSLSFGPHLLLCAEAASALRLLSAQPTHALREILRQSAHVDSIRRVQRLVSPQLDSLEEQEGQEEEVVESKESEAAADPAGEAGKPRFQILSPPLLTMIRRLSESLAYDPVFGKLVRPADHRSDLPDEAEPRELRFEALGWLLDTLSAVLPEALTGELGTGEENDGQPRLWRSLLTASEAAALAEVLQGILDEVELGAGDRQAQVEEALQNLRTGDAEGSGVSAAEDRAAGLP